MKWWNILLMLIEIAHKVMTIARTYAETRKALAATQASRTERRVKRQKAHR